jgi:hypothetical protein
MCATFHNQVFGAIAKFEIFFWNRVIATAYPQFSTTNHLMHKLNDETRIDLNLLLGAWNCNHKRNGRTIKPFVNSFALI